MSKTILSRAEQREMDALVSRAEAVRRLAYDHGFNPRKAASDQPVGVYDLWAMADKAIINAQYGLLGDARSYAREMEDSLRKVLRYAATNPDAYRPTRY